MSIPFTVIIPARFASTRLPGKMLADIAGKPMLQRVYEQAELSEAKRVVIATDHQTIFAAATQFAATVLLTSPDHPSGTDRLQEAAEQLHLADDAIVVNVQGDEPEIPPAVINQVAANLASAPWASVATLCEPILHDHDFLNPNAVKVVADRDKKALYFSRAPIPWHRDTMPQTGIKTDAKVQHAFRHIGIYAYRVNVLRQFVTWPVSPLEAIEKLEQLRVLTNGAAIHVDVACETVPVGVDTQADLDAVRNKFSMQR